MFSIQDGLFRFFNPNFTYYEKLFNHLNSDNFNEIIGIPQVFFNGIWFQLCPKNLNFIKIRNICSKFGFSSGTIKLLNYDIISKISSFDAMEITCNNLNVTENSCYEQCYFLERTFLKTFTRRKYTFVF